MALVNLSSTFLPMIEGVSLLTTIKCFLASGCVIADTPVTLQCLNVAIFNTAQVTRPPANQMLRNKSHDGYFKQNTFQCSAVTS